MSEGEVKIVVSVPLPRFAGALWWAKSAPGRAVLRARGEEEAAVLGVDLPDSDPEIVPWPGGRAVQWRWDA